MPERLPYDPDFKHLNPQGWQRLPRATRDAFINSRRRTIKERIYFYLIQVWDDKGSKYGYSNENVGIRQQDIVNDLDILDGTVSLATNQMAEEGLIEIGAEKRIYPVEQPVFKRPAKNGSIEGTVAQYWERNDREKFKKFLAWRESGKYWKKEIRDTHKLMKKQAQKTGPNVGLSDVGPVENGLGPVQNGVGPTQNDAGPSGYPLIKKEKIRTAAAEITVITEALDHYGDVSDAAAVEKLLLKCKEIEPNVTAPEVAQVVHMKGAQITKQRNVENPLGLILNAVPNNLRKILKQLRAVAAAPPEGEAPIEQQIKSAIDFIEMFPEHPQILEFVADLQRLESEHPELVREIRGREKAKGEGG